jgi:hypothetical protein
MKKLENAIKSSQKKAPTLKVLPKIALFFLETVIIQRLLLNEILMLLLSPKVIT